MLISNAVDYVKGRDQRIFMNARANGYVGIRENGDTIPLNSVMFGYNNYNDDADREFVALGFDTLSKRHSVALGYKSSAEVDSVSIGYMATRWNLDDPDDAGKSVIIGTTASAGSEAVAIGYNASGKPRSVVIGYQAKALNYGDSVAIGYNASSTYENSVAIGYNTKASSKNSVAIGYNAKTEVNNSIVLGTETDTVYIPGNLIVGKTTLIGAKSVTDSKKYPFYALAHYGHDSDGRHFTDLIDVIERNHASDYKGWGDFAMAMIDKKVPGVQVGSYKFKTGSWDEDYNDNQKICPPTNSSSDWSRWANGKCNSTKTDSTNELLYSDIRLKDVGETFTSGLDDLNKLEFYHFTFKDDKDKTPYVGVIAQDLEKVFPTAVKTDKDGYLQIRWDEMFYSALNAIKELNTKVVAIGEKLQQITQDIVDLKAITEKQQVVIEEQVKLLTEQQDEIKSLAARIEKLEHRKK